MRKQIPNPKLRAPRKLQISIFNITAGVSQTLLTLTWHVTLRKRRHTLLFPSMFLPACVVDKSNQHRSADSLEGKGVVTANAVDSQCFHSTNIPNRVFRFLRKHADLLGAPLVKNNYLTGFSRPNEWLLLSAIS